MWRSRAQWAPMEQALRASLAESRRQGAQWSALQALVALCACQLTDDATPPLTSQ